MKHIFLIICFFSIAAITFSQPVDPSHHVPENKNLPASWKTSLYNNQKKVFKGDELLTIGMPCGGIAAGQLYVRGDGTLANWWIYNNAYNTGYGIDSLTHFNTALGPWTVCYKTFEPKSYIDQGFNIKITQDGKTTNVNLNKKDFDDISFVGEYPIATINYNSTTKKLPVAVSSEVYSPFIPMNAKESATPGTILKYTVKNNSSKPVQVSLSGWLQNFVCLDIAKDILANRRNAIVRNDGITSLVMGLTRAEKTGAEKKPTIKLFDDFENGYGKWKVTGDAFGSAPTNGSFENQGRIVGFNGKGVVNSYIDEDKTTGKMVSETFTVNDDYIVFKIGGGRHATTTCINLIVDGNIVRTATGANTELMSDKYWDVKELKGRQAHFEIVDEDKGGWGHVTLDDIGFSDMPVTKEKYYPEHHPYFGNVSLSILSNNAFGDADYKDFNDNTKSATASATAIDKINGSVGESFSLQPGQSKEVIFLLTWYFPNRPSYYFGSDLTDILPNDWNEALPTDGATIIGNMYSNWFNNSHDVALYLQKNYSRLSKLTHLFHDTYYNNTTIPYWLNQRLLMPLSTLATETCQWWANDKFWAWEGVGSCVGTCTHVWNYEQALAHFFPELERNIRERTDFDVSFQKDGSVLARNGWGGVLIDGHAGAILKAYREYLNSKNNLFLNRNWDRIKRATEFIINEDGNEDGLIEKVQANTYDIAFYGANTYVGSLYLAALKAAAAMASVMNDTAFAQRCSTIAQAGENNTVKRLWNGEYFVQDVDLKAHPEYQYKDGCLSDQLFGQTWNHLNNLGYIYPKEKVKQTLESIWKYNWAPDVAVQNKIHPPERTYASFGEPGLLVCTWPKSEHMGEKGVRYRDEVWTGIEYQVATNMIYDNMVDEALSIVKAVDKRYSPEKHNPWNEIECGDHYARAMASWGVMLALEDYYYNGPQGVISFNPKIQPSHFEGFFTTAEAWGNIKQDIQNNQQKNSIVLKYGNLALQQIQLHCDKKPAVIKMLINGKPVKNSFSYEENTASVRFDNISLQADDNVDILISY
ncbi:GH116 family glycosyl hydrolase [Parafilimonas terrae]|uniref:Beta-Glucocerebrosidase 2 N terminal n=1 Tax=Parafilimonas terrae TaxID=1465490 RepID=A0A1I5TG55_9BACT|nr:GH116 family glycosyl hydrolase [Parafilimonas terrae]SFP82005.1 beta-Glucocerebrosidase 2 N terminal [Parafilimonas terrae]